MSDGRPFIPAWLDDAGLSPLAFRVLCRIYRRGNFYESKTKLEREFQVGNRAMAAAFQELVSGKFITEETAVGKPSIYRPSANQHRDLVPASTTPDADPVLSSTTPQCQLAPPPSADQHHHLVLVSTTKDTPIKETPKKVTPIKETPLPFASEEFKSAWGEWEQHRREKKKPVTPLSAKKSLQELAAMGEARAIAAISHSIAKGWQGIYEETKANSAPTTTVNLGRRKFAGIQEDIDLPL